MPVPNGPVQASSRLIRRDRLRPLLWKAQAQKIFSPTYFLSRCSIASLDPTTGQIVNQGSTAKGGIVKVLPSPKAQTGTAGVSWDTASPQEQALAQARYEGRVRSSDLGFRDRGRINALANEYASRNNLSPFVAYNADTNATMGKYATSGKLGQNALSLNTALGHADSVYAAYQDVKNTNINWINQPINALKKNTNDKSVIALGVKLNAFRGEMANVFKANGATDQEVESWKQQFNDSLTPDQAIAAMGSADELLRSRLNALEYQRAQAGGGNGQPLISPHAQEISNRLSGQGSQPSGLAHLSTKDLLDLKKKMTAHQSNGV
jgi:hypothetical protein